MTNLILDQERVDFLRARTDARVELLSAWPRPTKELKVAEVEVDWVRFSTLNHRTRAEQLKVVYEHNRPDLFVADPLGKAAQDAQYAILCAQKGFAELKQDLRERRQQEPAVITAEGVLINGNRRTAALRNLYHENQHLDARYIRCLVLPEDATAEELVDLEAELQIAKDFKQEYSWVNEAMLIEEIYEREGRSFLHVAKKMHREESEVRALFEKLQQLHQLVSLAKGARLHIDFTENESAFDELAKFIKTKPKSDQDSVRSTYFLGTLTGVNYRTLRHLRRPDAADLVFNAMKNEKGLNAFLQTVESHAALKPAGDDDPLDALLGIAPEGSQVVGSGKVSDVLAFLAAKRPHESIELVGGGNVLVQNLHTTIQTVIESAANDAVEDAKDATALTAPIARLDDAIDKLNRAQELVGRARAMPGWRENDFQLRVAKLREQLQKLVLPSA